MRRLLTLLVALSGILAAAVAQAGPRAELWPRWAAHDPASMRHIDHGEWDAFLKRYLRIGADGVHRVAYSQVTPADRARLDDYIASLGAVAIDEYSRAEQMAYWINLYNALIVRLIIEHYPVASIRDIGGGPGADGGGPWAEALIEVEGTPLSLNDIVHRILRPIWRDPRVHYALACGAVGCPNLQPDPFDGRQLDRQLNEAAMIFVNDPRGITIEGDRLGLSSIYRWYRGDFGPTERDVINHLMAYAEPDLAIQLQKFDRISDDGFDWRLNAAAS
jgi:Protein of unknown function, DUF547